MWPVTAENHLLIQIHEGAYVFLFIIIQEIRNFHSLMLDIKPSSAWPMLDINLSLVASSSSPLQSNPSYFHHGFVSNVGIFAHEDLAFAKAASSSSVFFSPQVQGESTLRILGQRQFDVTCHRRSSMLKKKRSKNTQQQIYLQPSVLTPL